MADWETDSGVVRGVVSRNFCERGAALVLGNELLAEADPDYAIGAISKFHVPAHTVERVVYTLRRRDPGLPLNWDPPPYVANAYDAFIGYLLLDAVVGNTDRHHENWGFIRTVGGKFHLAPTFDHASSLGRNLRDDDRARRLWTRDRNSDVAAFGKRARSALFKHEADARALLTSEAFAEAAHGSPRAALGWLERLGLMTGAEIGTIVGNVPQDRISATAAEFATTVICQNRVRLLAMRKDLQ
ncbi:MAG TPA: hypothetical protein VME43_23685 [Bryobacteraceae bacterium]|nr:hypothetical protein [Bryobacteraceae bacterium]